MMAAEFDKGETIPKTAATNPAVAGTEYDFDAPEVDDSLERKPKREHKQEITIKTEVPEESLPERTVYENEKFSHQTNQESLQILNDKPDSLSQPHKTAESIEKDTKVTGDDSLKIVDKETSELDGTSVGICKEDTKDGKTESEIRVKEEKIEKYIEETPLVEIQISKKTNNEEEAIDDWLIPASDDEWEDEVEGHERRTILSYEPSPEKIVELYNRLDKERVLELEWKCPGRKLPEDEEEKMEVEAENQTSNKDEEMVDDSMEEDANEFDFAIDSAIDTVTPRRTPATEHKGSSRKRVARMDKVLDDIMRYQRIDQEMVKEGEAPLPNMDITPQRPLGRFHIRRDLDA